MNCYPIFTLAPLAGILTLSLAAETAVSAQPVRPKKVTVHTGQAQIAEASPADCTIYPSISVENLACCGRNSMPLRGDMVTALGGVAIREQTLAEPRMYQTTYRFELEDVGALHQTLYKNFQAQSSDLGLYRLAEVPLLGTPDASKLVHKLHMEVVNGNYGVSASGWSSYQSFASEGPRVVPLWTLFVKTTGTMKGPDGTLIPAASYAICKLNVNFTPAPPPVLHNPQ